MIKKDPSEESCACELPADDLDIKIDDVFDVFEKHELTPHLNMIGFDVWNAISDVVEEVSVG